MHIWGCRVLVPAHNLKKSHHYRASEGKVYGFAKTRSLICWLYVTTDNIKHARGARFLEIDTLRPGPPIGQRMLSLDPDSKTCEMECTVLTIDIGDLAQFDTEPFQLTVQLPPVGSSLDVKMSFDESYHLPFLVSTISESVLVRSLPANFYRNIYILAIGSDDPVTINEVLDAFRSSQVPNAIADIDLWIVKRNNQPRNYIEEQRHMFNQVHYAPAKSPPMP
jgi:hypothetical protein